MLILNADYLAQVGTWPHTYNTRVAYGLVFIPPILISLVSAIYGIRSITAFNKSRTEFNDPSLELTSSHYLNC